MKKCVYHPGGYRKPEKECDYNIVDSLCNSFNKRVDRIERKFSKDVDNVSRYNGWLERHIVYKRDLVVGVHFLLAILVFAFAVCVVGFTIKLNDLTIENNKLGQEIELLKNANN